MNVVVVQGILSSEPVERTLPSGRNIMDWQVTTESETGKCSVPVQWEDPSKAVRSYGDGDEVVVLGRVRRRFFRAGGATAARTEVVATLAAKPSRKAAVERLLAKAREGLGHISS